MDKVKWGFIGCGEVVEMKSVPLSGKLKGLRLWRS